MTEVVETNQKLDKAKWGAGPWQDEPDRVKWSDPATGMPCIANRSRLGNWCGYVAVNPGHPAHGVPYDNVDVSVHGGLTYAGVCQGNICHIPEPGQPDDVYWLGFDCGHCGDLAPGMMAPASDEYRVFFEDRDVYRDLDYVRAECADLAKQLTAMNG